MNIEIVLGDITKMPVDAIVNAANPGLAAGGGVCGAIHEVAGPRLAEECATRYPMGCHTGGSAITEGYGLPARFCIHAVGPVWRGGRHGEEALLADAYQNSIMHADKVGAKSIAFPLISSGIYGYPLHDACYVALKAIREQGKHGTDVEQVYIVVLDERVACILNHMLEALAS